MSAALIVSGFVLLAGCSQMQNPTYDLAQVGCGTVAEPTLATIQTKITAEGRLRNGRMTTSGGQTFVSAELHLRSHEAKEKGDILTWLTDDVEGDQFESVDVNARENSTWPDADVTVTTPGARESRACAAAVSGKTRAQVQCESEQASGETPLDFDCEDR